MASLQQTLEQERAARAFQDVQEAIKLDEKDRKKYGPLAKKLPSYILTNGLGQALAFLQAKGKKKPGDPHIVLYQQISEFVGGDKDLLSKVMKADSVEYRRLTAKTMAYLNWLKRFAEAEADKLGTEDNGD